jgi:HPt (histidine-containing phosphotransfer) domain-containing protein
MTSKDASTINALLTSLWERGLPQLRERLEILDRAAMAAASENLTEALRTEALEIAHKLAGSLGMFGYAEGTEIARQLEQLLNHSTTANSSPLAELVAKLHQTLQLN